MSEILNKEQNWNGFRETYYDQYLDDVSPEDAFLETFCVNNIADLSTRHNIEYGSLTRGIDICNGGVPINPAFMAPLFADNGRIEWADYGLPQIRRAQDLIIHREVPAGWLRHEAVMAEEDPHWNGSMARACILGKPTWHDIFSLPEETWEFATTGYGPESITTDPGEWEEATTRFFRSVKIGGIALMEYMINSTGYSSAGTEYHSMPITSEDVITVAKRYLKDIRVGQVFTSKAARAEDDPHTYDGMGAILGIRT